MTLTLAFSKYVCMYLGMYSLILFYMCVCVCVCKFMYVIVCVRGCMCGVHAHVHVHVCACACAPVCTCACACACARMLHMHVCACVHMHMCTCGCVYRSNHFGIALCIYGIDQHSLSQSDGIYDLDHTINVGYNMIYDEGIILHTTL